jgi:hypothetical protein
MERLAQVGEAGEDGERPKRQATAVFFALGSVSGALLGGAALVALELVVPAGLRALSEQSAALFTVALATGNSASAASPSAKFAQAPVQGVASMPREQPEVFEVAIERKARARAAFALRLVGAQDQDFEILMRDVPAGAELSRGERRNASTWALEPADLDDLHLALNEGAPEAFDLRIDVVARSGVAAGSSVARVRLVDAHDAVQTAGAALERPRDNAAPAAPDAVSEVQPKSEPVVAQGRHRMRDDKAKAVSAPTTAVVPSERHWPEGASGLGAVVPSTERQVWWKLPPPSWSPFAHASGNLP